MSLQSVSTRPQSTRPRSSRRSKSYAVICADCNESTTVPFRPNPSRPVYCRPCFLARRSDQSAKPDAPTNKPPGTNDRTDDSASSGDGVFPGIELKPATRRALSSMNISQPTPIQTESIPPLLDGRDLIGQARTGSGKTLAFAVPLTEQCDPSNRRVQALVLVPTRELAIQVAEVTKALCSSHRLRVTLLYGGRSAKPEYAELKNGAQIIIGTPGRTLDHLRQGTLDLSSVRYLVLDEADEMLDRGFARDVEAILSETPSERQTALLSATLPEWVATTAKKHLRNPVSVEIDTDLRTLPTVEHMVYS
ncbi:MAG: DEAD/DEAH box helicase, partial [Chloroflexi bacterium]|nr:DEAD/DEAH box helicase [Chloroflexota bacterium]